MNQRKCNNNRSYFSNC